MKIFQYLCVDRFIKKQIMQIFNKISGQKYKIYMKMSLKNMKISIKKNTKISLCFQIHHQPL